MAAKRISPGIYEVNGKRVNAVNEEEAMKKAGVQKGAPKQPAAAPKAKDPLASIPKQIKNVQQGVQAEKTVAEESAKGQIKYGNAGSQVNPFGRQDITYDEQGRPVVTQSLDPSQQAIVDQDTRLSQMGRGMAESLIGQGGLGQAFNPNLDPRTSTGDFVADRRRQEQDLQNYLSRDFATNKAQEKNDIETALYSRGIPLDPMSDAYQRAMKSFDDKWARQEADVRAQALQFGGSELDRSFGMNEQRRANQFSEQQGTRQQQLGEVGAWSQFGQGAQLPQFQGFQGANYQIGSPVEINAALTAAQQNAQQLKMQKQALNRQGGGGGGGAGQQPVEQSPFVDG